MLQSTTNPATYFKVAFPWVATRLEAGYWRQPVARSNFSRCGMGCELSDQWVTMFHSPPSVYLTISGSMSR
jgi:hypothetical protein